MDHNLCWDDEKRSRDMTKKRYTPILLLLHATKPSEPENEKILNNCHTLFNPNSGLEEVQK